jgi:hypothetical protein
MEAVAIAQRERNNAKANLLEYDSDSDELSDGGKAEKRRLRKRYSLLKYQNISAHISQTQLTLIGNK